MEHLRNQKYSDIREHADGFINADTITNFESVRRFTTAASAIDEKTNIFHWLTVISVEKSSNNIGPLCAKVYACNLQAT